MLHIRTQRARHIESMLIRRRYYVDTSKLKLQLPRHFHVLFRCSFTERKIHLISTCFFRRNFDGWKTHIISMSFFKVISLVEKYTLSPRTILDVILLVENSTLFPRTSFDIISLVETRHCSTYFFRCNFSGRRIHVI